MPRRSAPPTTNSAPASTREYPPGRITVSDRAVLDQLRYAGVPPEVLGYVAAWGEDCLSRTGVLGDRFYAHLKSFPHTSKIRNDNTTIERQRPMLEAYFRSMFQNSIDEENIDSRLRMGAVHDRIDLGPLWYAAMYRFFQEAVADALHHRRGLHGRVRPGDAGLHGAGAVRHRHLHGGPGRRPPGEGEGLHRPRSRSRSRAWSISAPSC
ncbi:MAG: protoglobin family protein [Acidimicrobiia bacterium]